MSGVVKLVLLVVVLVVVFGAGVGVGSVPVVPEPVPTVTVTADPGPVVPGSCLVALGEAERIFGVSAEFAALQGRALEGAQAAFGAVLDDDLVALREAAGMVEGVPELMDATTARLHPERFADAAEECRAVAATPR